MATYQEIELENLNEDQQNTSSKIETSASSDVEDETSIGRRSKQPLMRLDSWYDKLMVFKPLGLEKFDT